MASVLMVMGRAMAVSLLAAVAGCGGQPTAPLSAPTAMVTTEFDAGDNLSGQLTAAAVIRTADAVMKLPITLRLHNHRKRTVELTASTPCAVFRWQVMAAGEVIQIKPNLLCTQVVATDRLGPAQQLEQSYLLSLDPRRYIVGGRYRLVYTFWGYPGQHDFTVKKRR